MSDTASAAQEQTHDEVENDADTKPAAHNPAHTTKAEKSKPEENVVPIYRPKKIAESKMELTEGRQQFWTVFPPAGTDRDDVVQPIFWTHVAKKLRPTDEIRVMPEDGKWYGVYLVLYADANQAKVIELSHHDIDANLVETDAEPFIVGWISPPREWGVRRRADKVILQADFKTKQDAYAWAKANVKH